MRTAVVLATVLLTVLASARSQDVSDQGADVADWLNDLEQVVVHLVNSADGTLFNGETTTQADEATTDHNDTAMIATTELAEKSPLAEVEDEKVSTDGDIIDVNQRSSSSPSLLASTKRCLGELIDTWTDRTWLKKPQPPANDLLSAFLPLRPRGTDARQTGSIIAGEADGSVRTSILTKIRRTLNTLLQTATLGLVILDNNGDTSITSGNHNAGSMQSTTDSSVGSDSNSSTTVTSTVVDSTVSSPGVGTPRTITNRFLSALSTSNNRRFSPATSNGTSIAPSRFTPEPIQCRLWASAGLCRCRNSRRNRCYSWSRYVRRRCPRSCVADNPETGDINGVIDDTEDVSDANTESATTTAVTPTTTDSDTGEPDSDMEVAGEALDERDFRMLDRCRRTTPSSFQLPCAIEATVMPHPLFCSCYYRCTNRQKRLHVCSGGRHADIWAPSSRRCVDPARSPCLFNFARRR